MSKNQKNNIIDAEYAELLPFPTFIINEEGTITQWSTTAEIAFDTSQEAIIDQSMTVLANYFTDTFPFKTLQELSNKPKASQLTEISVKTKDGSSMRADFVTQPCTYQGQKSLLCAVVFEDTNVNGAVLLKELVDMRLALDETQMLVTLDHEGFILAANDNFLRASAWTPKRIIGKSFWQLFPDKTHGNTIPEQIWRSLQQGNVWHGEAEQLTKNGSTYWTALTAIPTYCPIRKTSSFILLCQDISHTKNELTKLQKYAYVDAETGLHNSYWLEDEITKLVKEQREFSFVYLSIDKFYTIKELHSSELQESLGSLFKQRLETYFQDSTIVRINEIDFALLTSLSDWFIEGFLHYLEKNPIYYERVALPISISGGITRFPSAFTTYTQLMKTSTATVAKVRSEGGNKIVSLTPAHHRQLNRKSLLETRLLKALDEKNLQVLYQPQIDGKTNAIVGVEAFVRWHDEVVGTVSPGELIPLAEETGLIHQIGLFVLREACLQAVKWSEAGTPIKVSVNSSVREFRDKNMASSVMKILQETQCPPTLLYFEITEKFALEAEFASSIQTQLEQLEQLGVSFVLDDFGTGYGSFRYMQILPITSVKVDETFIHATHKSPKTKRLVHSMVQLGKNLGLTVVAEGVETKEQWHYLASIDCDIIQGYIISKPVTANAISEKLHNA